MTRLPFRVLCWIWDIEVVGENQGLWREEVRGYLEWNSGSIEEGEVR